MKITWRKKQPELKVKQPALTKRGKYIAKSWNGCVSNQKREPQNLKAVLMIFMT